MDKGLCLSEEYRGVERECDRPVYKVEFRELDRLESAQVCDFLPLFWEYWLRVNHEDTSGKLLVQWHGAQMEVIEIEKILYEYVAEGAKVQCAYYDNEIVGFLLYHIAYNCIMVVRAMYFIPEFREKKLAPKLLNSVSNEIEKVIFQTRKDNPPDQLFKAISDRATKIKDDKFGTIWEMRWNNGV